MPNWIKNQIKASDRVIDFMIKDSKVDFSNVIPQPSNIEKGHCDRRHPEGVICWVDWNNSHWDTKWNATDTFQKPGSVTFSTAWSHPSSVIRALSKKFSGERIIVSFADEDIGHNLGLYIINNGLITHEYDFDFGTSEAKDFASLVWHGRTYLDYVDDTYGVDTEDGESCLDGYEESGIGSKSIAVLLGLK